MTYIKKPIFRHPSLPTNEIGLTYRDYEGVVSTLCAGCGHDSITASIIDACYELSLPRRKFGEAKLGIEYIEKPPEKDMRFDLFFSSHVIEHMQNPIILRDWIVKSLKDDGISFITCPNGSDSAKFNKNWSQSWGEVHPNFISDRFLCKNFSDFKGTIFDESLLSEEDLASKLCIKEISSMLPESPNLWFIAQKIN